MYKCGSLQEQYVEDELNKVYLWDILKSHIGRYQLVQQKPYNIRPMCTAACPASVEGV